MSLIENPPGVYFPFRCCSYELKKSLSEESCCLVLHHSLIKFAWYQDSLVHTVLFMCIVWPSKRIIICCWLFLRWYRSIEEGEETVQSREIILHKWYKLCVGYWQSRLEVRERLSLAWFDSSSAEQGSLNDDRWLAALGTVQQTEEL